MTHKYIELPSGTWVDCVKRTFPALTTDECDSLLWEATAFPMASGARVMEQISDWAARANDLGQILYLTYGEMDRMLGEYLDETRPKS